MHYAIDGSNVLLCLNRNGKLAARAFVTLIDHLTRSRHILKIYFDRSISGHMRDRGAEGEWSQIEHAMRAARIDVTFVPHADPELQAYCRTHEAVLLTGTDKLDSWTILPRVVHRASLKKGDRNAKLINVIDSFTGEVVSAPIPVPPRLEWEGITLIEAGAEEIPSSFTLPRGGAENVTNGTLMVFALDSSASMLETKTYDGRPKHTHLSELLKKSMARLLSSRIGDGLYVTFLRFSDEVSLFTLPSGTDFGHISEWERFMSKEAFNYLEGMQVGNTNLRLAVQRSKEIIQDALLEQDKILQIADRWRAVVIIITDGRHVVMRPDGSFETDSDVAREAMYIHGGISGMKVRLEDDRICVGCVGIGEDLNHDLLLNISSPCTENQQRMAEMAGVKPLLVQGRLFIRVDSSDQRYSEAIRSFINVASSSI